MTNTLLALKNKTVLFAEDDDVMREQTAEILSMIFKQVYTARDGEEAYERYEDERPDIIITDIKMPRKDGLKLIKQIRQKDYTTPIILLTSFTDPSMLIDAANLSVDGYLLKPIEFEQLTLTICTAMQRIQKGLGLIKLREDLFYNIGTKEIYYKGNYISLGSKEHELLELFIKNRHLTLTKEDIATHLWPFDPICDSAIKNLILRIRKKLGDDIILSVRSIGYRLNTYDEIKDLSDTLHPID
ncbi:response regulator transcription factor [Sulfurospirillum arsenophilum]|uniref:response regulator transcription factor n=1 Tax=Sulfurospirillum arsenophilum TaxID=56698 RepID=UPI0005AADB62|nr:response regulator transcription factor [Sulfurospirillum arsenophilum]